MKINNPLKGFYVENDKINLDFYGMYRAGLTAEEIRTYLKARGSTTKYKNSEKLKNIRRLINKFYDIAGANTVSMTPNGEILMYRHDVERYADVLFDNKSTYFD
jgi:hypothetical protein